MRKLDGWKTGRYVVADSLARGETGGVSGASDSDLKARLALAEERLDFYASFDRLIQDNVAQASRLMRDALELRERTQAELDLAKSQAEERFAAERGRYRLDLESVHADLLALQATAASMARRVAATIGAMNASEDLAAAGAHPGLAAAVTAVAVVGSTEAVLPVADGAAVGEADEAESAVEALAEEEAAPQTASAPEAEASGAPQAIEAEVAALGSGEQPQVAEPAPAVAEAEAAVADGHPEEVSGDGDAGFSVGAVEPESGQPEPAVDTAPDQGEQLAAAPAAVAEPAPPAQPEQPEQPAEAPQPPEPDEVDTPGPRSMPVLVHGGPRAAAALALQRHLHGLSKVESVEAREYAEGVLRLHVVTGGRLGMEDLRGWEAGAGMEPVTVSADVLEVKLPGAQSL
jgi:hypothetical protein